MNRLDDFGVDSPPSPKQLKITYEDLLAQAYDHLEYAVIFFYFKLIKK